MIDIYHNRIHSVCLTFGITSNRSYIAQLIVDRFKWNNIISLTFYHLNDRTQLVTHRTQYVQYQKIAMQLSILSTVCTCNFNFHYWYNSRHKFTRLSDFQIEFTRWRLMLLSLCYLLFVCLLFFFLLAFLHV